MGPALSTPLDCGAPPSGPRDVCLAHAGHAAQIAELRDDVAAIRRDLADHGRLVTATSRYVVEQLGEVAGTLRAEMREIAVVVTALRDAETRRAAVQTRSAERDAWVDAHRRAAERSVWLRSRALRVAVRVVALLGAAGAGGWLWQVAPAVWRAITGG